jgi:hypothetical protein
MSLVITSIYVLFVMSLALHTAAGIFLQALPHSSPSNDLSQLKHRLTGEALAPTLQSIMTHLATDLDQCFSQSEIIAAFKNAIENLIATRLTKNAEAAP